MPLPAITRLRRWWRATLAYGVVVRFVTGGWSTPARCTGEVAGGALGAPIALTGAKLPGSESLKSARLVKLGACENEMHGADLTSKPSYCGLLASVHGCEPANSPQPCGSVPAGALAGLNSTAAVSPVTPDMYAIPGPSALVPSARYSLVFPCGPQPLGTVCWVRSPWEMLQLSVT